ncbi:hypothetical protein HCU64_23700 [Methylobacterium sp. C25]|uniref:hypothetical protein n=1 Tax=Methylobacterium sp. C25 TaxID=2721622 RepID=UPI001F3EEDDA|nr:hypothetical protein [Methylobacterium sp. C25]MCE4226750.1 hypothetical protein [Methylobacterium sp. C25]
MTGLVPGVFTLGVPAALKAGNAQFFDPDPACLVQLRPMLASEITPLTGAKDNAILFARGRPGEMLVLAYVKVPPSMRRNDRECVMRALRRLETFDPSAAKIVRERVGRTRWPAEHRSFEN